MNHLQGESSPYLIQHADNPVDWYPWCEDAFEKAKREGKPIFLSIGYSTCHWCHVMARESFRDKKIARLMNRVFVNIKVDREERPDVDKIYILTAQMLSGRAGWPLSIIMTPEKEPFFAATYIPKSGRKGMVGMLELIPQIEFLWAEKKGEIIADVAKVKQALNSITETSSAGTLSQVILKKSFSILDQAFDDVYGGFGMSPKFPTTHNLTILLRYWFRTREDRAKQIIIKTLKGMMNGGIYDRLAGGFHRYSTDREWVLPHFEKMLYDQAMISMSYAQAYAAFKIPEFKDVADKTLEYCIRDLMNSNGSFYSAEDADSEGVEGKFYTWKKNELKKHLNNDEFALITNIFSINDRGNFHDPHGGVEPGSNILYLRNELEIICQQLNISIDTIKVKLDSIYAKLLKVREARPRPGLDDKVLCDWNGLMVWALAQAGRVFDDKYYIDTAIKAFNSITETFFIEGRLYHSKRRRSIGIPGNLDDYMFLCRGSLELFEATGNCDYLSFSCDLLDHTLKHFWDNYNGGFYFTADYDEQLIIRSKDAYDGAIPSGNSIALENLLKLSRILYKPEYESSANNLIKVFANRISENPVSYTQFLQGFDYSLGPASEVVIAGIPEDNRFKDLVRIVNSEFIPNIVVVLKNIKDEPKSDCLDKIKDYGMIDGKPAAYLCSDFTCSQPVNSVEEWKKKIKDIIR